MRQEEMVDPAKPIMEMPRYRCHKEVHALKIEDIDAANGILSFQFPFTPIQPPPSWFQKHKPEVGGYYVLYADGYVSYSPAKAFEDGYSTAEIGTKQLRNTNPFHKPSQHQLENRYSYHAPKDGQGVKYEAIRAHCLELSKTVVNLTPCCPEQSRALNSLDEVMFLANAAIARNE